MSDQPEVLASKPQYTGRRLVKLDPNAGFKEIEREAGEASLRLASASEFKSHEEDYVQAFEQADGIVFENFGVAVINENHQEEINTLTDSARINSFLYDEPERFIYAVAEIGPSGGGGFWQWLMRLLGFFPKPPVPPTPVNPNPNPILPDSYADNATAYWGIQAVRALSSPYTGKNVKMAILDTGFLLGHPDFETRIIQSKSFIPGEDVNDLNGHGTHCTGVAAGGLRGSNQIKYGVAPDSNIYIGKVLSNAGSGSDSGIIAGLDWAMSSGCKVISMSLGAPTRPGQSYSRIYEDIAKQGLEKGTIIIAAAGNESNRSANSIKPVGHPANCPSIMAVAAIDRFLKVADFSCGAVNDNGGEINIAGPGVGIMSSYKAPQNYISISGTSMATPFVSGVAAQLWEQNPGASPSQIWEKLIDTARAIGHPASDVGAGLVQSPQ
jgi:subtilisin